MAGAVATVGTVATSVAGITGGAGAMMDFLKRMLTMKCRSCSILIQNRTAVELKNVSWHEQCGRSSGDPSPPSIPPGVATKVDFSRSFGLLGCAGLLSYQYSEKERFVIAFRVPMVQVRKKAKNFFAIASMAEAKDVNCDMYKDMVYKWKPVQQPNFVKGFAADGKPIQITTNGVKMRCTMSRDNNAGISFEICSAP